jgi:DNA helicase-2/ATP-dependent DNA helicase PcrA
MANQETDKDRELTEEKETLARTLALASRLLEHLSLRAAKSRQAVIAAKRELGESVAHSIGELYSEDGFQELAAAGQQVSQISRQLDMYDDEAAKILRLEKMLNSPYFARIDFLFDGESRPEKIYIGRSSLKDTETNGIVVYDWRAPVAGVFYRFNPGVAWYDAPAGKIGGRLLMKRQFEIKEGKLEYFFDADVEVADEFLRRLLSQNSSLKMKNIVETIQREQDAVIRDTESQLLMVQGAAGSGKTSIGLHRVAWLLYRDRERQGSLSAENIVVLSPNTVFEQYIANVLPELGEKNAVSLTTDKILNQLLLPGENQGGRPLTLQSRNHLLETLLGSGDEEESRLLKASLEFKTSEQFLELMGRFVRDLPRRFIDFQDIDYGGRTIAGRQYLKNKIVNNQKGLPLTALLKQLETLVLERVHALRPDRLKKLRRLVREHTENSLEIQERARLLSIRESTVLMKTIRSFTELDCFALYCRLFEKEEYFYRLAKDLALPESIGQILRRTRENLRGRLLCHDDALALAWFTLAVRGYHEGRGVRQVVVDEAQDYYPLHFRLFARLFPQAHYTVLGDVSQAIGKEADLSIYEQIRRILGKKQSSLAVMNKSFRCTQEILDYSGRFLEDSQQAESFSRRGEEPAIYRAPDREALVAQVLAEAAACREKGYRSVALICKTAAAACRWYACLGERSARPIPGGELKLIHEGRESGPEGIFLIPVYMAKGLEFDAVLILETDRKNYRSQEDKRLLYIACTRALHRLALFYEGEISPLLEGGRSIDR